MALCSVGGKNGEETAPFCFLGKRKGENFYENWVFCDGLFGLLCRKARLCNRWWRREECHLHIKLKHLGQEREVIYF